MDAVEEGLLIVVVDEGEFPDGANGREDDSMEEPVERMALVVGVVPVGGGPMLVIIVTGPEPKENTMDGVEQHSLLSKS